ncbi:cellulase family glycosylhydrolase [Catenovulum sp. 2E275]|uniref:cellulase family glycosylhydrolase n=1 Tax=Catenovulum sp. 2E275 TaxID=2980497 RepID=UPI0021CEED77|nr:cellulase family glycosylhydrolase [Catenovulum sp. 2E275]MCU4675894.1 cellulase family glycosylhydrolase [Catenovulum sp. 2E275]
MFQSILKNLINKILFCLISLSCVSAHAISDGRYIFVNKLSGKVLDVSAASQADGANVIQWAQGAGLNQRWDVNDLGNGYYAINAAHSGKTLDVEGWNPDNGANLTQYTYYGNDNQQWLIESTGSGYYKITSKFSGKSIEVESMATYDGANIRLWDYWGDDSQLWSLIPVAAQGTSKSATQIVSEMGAGWNLGNTLDAIGGETAWGNPLTQQYMINSVAAQGFKTIRIPVTWQGHFSGSDNTIDSAWLDRVEQVVNYALDANLYVIINLHHDEWIVPTYANQAATSQTLADIWSQIAERFKNYNQYLIFETLNEPRANKGTSLEWSGTLENYEVVNTFNQVALNEIRNSGGNNSNRLVLLPGYAASPWEDQIQHIDIPSDNMIAISTHGYIPYTFTEQEVADGGDMYFDDAEKDLINYVFDNLNSRFVSNGIPVVMGEWGSVDKANTQQRAAYAQYYQAKANSLGIPTIVWDNNALGGSAHNYRLYDRANDQWVFPSIINSIINP